MRRAAPAPPPLPPSLAAYYDYPRHTPEAVVELVRTERAYREYLVRFPLSAAAFTPTEPVIEVEWFESTMPGRRAAILFNPILGGDYPIERGICHSLAASGFHVALVHRKTLKIAPEHPVGHIEVLLRQGLVRIRQVVDWMAAQERVDANRMGSFGISMGGIASVMAAAVEPRLRCHVVALAGGGIADILLTSHDTLLTKPLRRYLQHNRMDLASLAPLLRQAITTDPVRLAPYADARHLFLVIALADRTIGGANSLRLWNALGRPTAIFLPLGHYSAYLVLPYIRYAGLRFIQQQLR